jgi:membrane protease YdiL (CAAX protease family)
MAAPRIAAAAGAAQVLRGAAEELFFRGLLQTTLVWLLVQAGLPDRRLVRGCAIVVVSLGFTLEHVDIQAPAVVALGASIYIFLMSTILGTLLEASRNLYLPILGHTAINLPLVHAVPLPVNATGAPLLTPSGIGLFFLVLLFTGLAVEHEWPRWTAPPPED